jgi:hypothetical protein
MDVYLSQNARPPQTTTVKSPEISAEAEEEPSPTHRATTARSENFRKQLDNAGIVNMEMLKKMVMSTVLTVCSLYWADSGMRLRLTRAQEAALEPLTAATPSTAPARMTHQRRVRGRQARPVSKERAALPLVSTVDAPPTVLALEGHTPSVSRSSYTRRVTSTLTVSGTGSLSTSLSPTYVGFRARAAPRAT